MFSGNLFSGLQAPGLFSSKAKTVIDLKTSIEEPKTLIGEKAKALTRCVRLGLEVPDGMIVTTLVSRQFAADRVSLAPQVKDQILQGISELEKKSDRVFFKHGFDATTKKFPMLLSVRQSPVLGFPGMGTVLNVGINMNVMETMRTATGRNTYVLDTYRRFLQDWGTHVQGIPMERYKNIVDDRTTSLGLRSGHSVSEQPFNTSANFSSDNTRSSLTTFMPPTFQHLNQFSYSELESIVREFEKITTYPVDPRDQLFQVVEAMFHNYNSIEARSFRAAHNIKSEGTAGEYVSPSLPLSLPLSLSCASLTH